MTLPWVRLDTGLASHDKVLTLLDDYKGKGLEALAIYCLGLGHCGGQETDGLVTFAALRMIHGTRRHAEMLVTVGLWRPHPKGWEVTNYLTRQISADVAEQTRNDKRRASVQANCVRWHGKDCGCWRRKLLA